MNLLEAITYQKSMWNSITTRSIKNCFRHLNIYVWSKWKIYETESEILTILIERFLISIPKDEKFFHRPFAKYICIDENVLTWVVIKDKEIIAALTENKDDYFLLLDEDEEIDTEQKSLMLLDETVTFLYGTR